MRIAIAMLLAAVVAAGLHWGTFAVGGSDSYCYVHQAQGWSTGRLQVVEPLALDAPWPDAPLTFAPAGHVPSPNRSRRGRSHLSRGTVDRDGAVHVDRPHPLVRGGRLQPARRDLPRRSALRRAPDLVGLRARIALRASRRPRLGAARRVQPRIPVSARAADERRAGGGAVGACGGVRDRLASGVRR